MNFDSTVRSLQEETTDASASNASASPGHEDNKHAALTRGRNKGVLTLVTPMTASDDDSEFNGATMLARVVRGQSYSPTALNAVLRVLARLARSPSSGVVVALAQIAEAIGTKALLRAICVANGNCTNLLPYVLADTFLLTKTSQLVLATTVDGLRAPSMTPPPGAGAYWSCSTEPFALARQHRSSPRFHHEGVCSRIVCEPRMMPTPDVGSVHLSSVFALARALEKSLRAIQALYDQEEHCERAVSAFDGVASQLNLLVSKNLRTVLSAAHVNKLNASFCEIDASMSTRQKLIRDAHQQLSAVARLYGSREIRQARVDQTGVMCDVFDQVWHWIGQETTLLEERVLRCRAMLQHCQEFALGSRSQAQRSKPFAAQETDESIFTSLSNIITAININRCAADETLDICMLLRERCEDRAKLIYRIPSERFTLAALLDRFERTLGSSRHALFECDTSLHAIFLRHRNLINELRNTSSQIGGSLGSRESVASIAVHEIAQIALSASKFADRLAENWVYHRHWLTEKRRLIPLADNKKLTLI